MTNLAIETDVVKVQTGTAAAPLPLRLPDSDSVAEAALAQAIDFCAHKLSLAERQGVVERLRRGDPGAHQYCDYSIASSVAEFLGELDQKVKAVYLLDYDATPEDLCLGEARISPMLHLVVWAERRSNALDSLLTALDRALSRQYAEVVGMPRLAHFLDAQVVDDAEVGGRLGYGALLSSLHNRPTPVWERSV